jgi:hypothetical protein
MCLWQVEVHGKFVRTALQTLAQGRGPVVKKASPGHLSIPGIDVSATISV